MWALIFKNTIIQIEAQKFPVHESMTWYELPPGSPIEVGYQYEDDQFTPPPSEEPKVIPDTIFQKAVKKAFKALLQFINGTITKSELNDIFDSIKDHLVEID